ncbi:major facilitator protein [Mycoplasmopsis californica]|uniref:Major facilitator protein n=2 Tax=Mycoplasmopsis californica TaxID=2113 RepID=A0A059XSK9_9BACT|nr:hexose phosphate transporter [Mycoplasmopsis californica]AIA29758.1 major facilitator protein [Mycoplasmopsis californica]
MQTKLSFEDKLQKNKALYGIFIWLFISIAYLLFIANWGFGGYLTGKGISIEGDKTILNPGILGYFGINGNDSSFLLKNQAANWGITIGRGIGSVAVALLLSKLFHKYTTIVALSLTLLGIPAQFLPSQPYGYVLFLVLRTLMAIGGTMMIILTQPIVANFFTKKQKSVVSQFGIWFYPLGTIIAVLPFVVAHYTKANDVVMNNWKTILTTLSALNVIPLLVMIIFGSRFDAKKAQEEESMEKQESGLKLLGVYFRKKATWAWTLLYGGWLCAVVLPTALSHVIFPKLAEIAGNPAGEATHIREWYIVFLAAVFVGPITIGLWSRFPLKRKWYIASVILLGISLYVLSMITYVWGVSKGDITSRVIFYILGFLSGLSLWGIQGVMLNTPHEYKDNNPKTIGWMFSLIWGLGFIFFTLVLILINLVPIIAGGKFAVNNIWMYVIIIVASLISVIGLLMLKEPDPEANTFPWSNKK